MRHFSRAEAGEVADKSIEITYTLAVCQYYSEEREYKVRGLGNGVRKQP